MYCQCSPGNDPHGQRDDYGLHALNPSILTCYIAYFVTGSSYIFESQVNMRAESPAHRHEYSATFLKALKV